MAALLASGLIASEGSEKLPVVAEDGHKSSGVAGSRADSMDFPGMEEIYSQFATPGQNPA